MFLLPSWRLIKTSYKNTPRDPCRGTTCTAVTRTRTGSAAAGRWPSVTFPVFPTATVNAAPGDELVGGAFGKLPWTLSSNQKRPSHAQQRSAQLHVGSVVFSQKCSDLEVRLHLLSSNKRTAPGSQAGSGMRATRRQTAGLQTNVFWRFAWASSVIPLLWNGAEKLG